MPTKINGARPYEQSDALTIYLREIRAVPLLTRLEERKLFRQMRNGNKAESAIARTHLITANVRLVVSIAKKYVGYGVPFLDLINEGNIGLMKAVERFRVDTSARFATYATLPIKQKIFHALSQQGKLIRLPTNVVQKLRIMRRKSAQLESELGRDPVMSELVSCFQMASTDINSLIAVSSQPFSLDHQVGEDSMATAGDLIADNTADCPREVLTQKETTLFLRRTISYLPPRDAFIIRARFGLDDGPPKSLEEVGDELGLTRERVRQLQDMALDTLRVAVEQHEKDRVIDNSASIQKKRKRLHVVQPRKRIPKNLLQQNITEKH